MTTYNLYHIIDTSQNNSGFSPRFFGLTKLGRDWSFRPTTQKGFPMKKIILLLIVISNPVSARVPMAAYTQTAENLSSVCKSPDNNDRFPETTTLGRIDRMDYCDCYGARFADCATQTDNDFSGCDKIAKQKCRWVIGY